MHWFPCRACIKGPIRVHTGSMSFVCLLDVLADPSCHEFMRVNPAPLNVQSVLKGLWSLLDSVSDIFKASRWMLAAWFKQGCSQG